jgi:pimeloyl-ACP methyl ester carboxylesterase
MENRGNAARMTLTSHRVQLTAVRLHYIEAGSPDAPALVLLHGWPQTWLEWHSVIPHLAANHRLIIPDLRGLGDSSRPPIGYDARSAAADIIELLDFLKLSHVGLVGHDIGALVAYSAAAHWRDRFNKVVILDVLLPGYGLDALVRHSADGWGIWHFPFHASPVAEFLIAGREREYMNWFFRNMAYSPRAIADAHVDEYVRAYAAPGAMRAALGYYSSFYITGLQNRESGMTPLTIPVLAIGGEASVGRMVADEMRKVASNVTEAIAPLSGHWIPEEQPQWLAAQLLQFFAPASIA